MKKLVEALLITIITLTNTFAQRNDNEDIFSKGNKYYQNQEYINALNTFLDIHNIHKKNDPIAIKLLVK